MTRCIFILIASLALAMGARADFTFGSSGSGGYSSGTPVWGANGWQIDLTATVNGSGVFCRHAERPITR